MPGRRKSATRFVSEPSGSNQRGHVKASARNLTDFHINDDGVMVCQSCRNEMPLRPFNLNAVVIPKQ